MYHMYVGKYERNADIEGEALVMSAFIFQRMDEQSYSERLKEEYEKTSQSFFEGQIDEAYETDEKGMPLTISAEALEENEDELIRLMHDKFINGEDSQFFNYESVDCNEEYDDRKLLD